MGASGDGDFGGASTGIGKRGGVTDALGSSADEDGFTSEVGLADGGYGGVGIGVDGRGELCT